jgi:hypothetical protein
MEDSNRSFEMDHGATVATKALTENRSVGDELSIHNKVDIAIFVIRPVFIVRGDGGRCRKSGQSDRSI